MCDLTRPELQTVIDNNDAPSAQVAAVQHVLKARDGEGATK